MSLLSRFERLSGGSTQAVLSRENINCRIVSLCQIARQGRIVPSLQLCNFLEWLNLGYTSSLPLEKGESAA